MELQEFLCCTLQGVHQSSGRNAFARVAPFGGPVETPFRYIKIIVSTSGERVCLLLFSKGIVWCGIAEYSALCVFCYF